MDKEALKLIVNNLESLVQCLKREVYSNEDVNQYQEISPPVTDYDEVFCEYDD